MRILSGAVCHAHTSLNNDGVRVIAPRPTHQDLASRVGASREMVSKLMKDLVRGGYVREEGRTLVTLRPLPSNW